MSKLPCDNCFLLPLCRNKDYEKLLKDCKLITALLYSDYKDRNKTMARTPMFISYIIELQDKFKPSKWNLVEHESLGYIIGEYL